MHLFEAWAPKAEKLAVKVDGSTTTMAGPDRQGWWRAEAADAGPGSNYGFLIDDDERCYPDPRSRWQPDGVHALSRVYDQNAFAWEDPGFQAAPLSSAIIYELHAGTFTPEGTLDAAIHKLSYLVELGITHIELMPVASFEGDRGWGYDGVALFSVHQPYGGPDALKRFVNAAHKHGLAVLLDVVYNHFGPAGNYTGKFGLYATDAHHTPWGGAVNLEGAWSNQVRRYFCDNALMWLRDFRIDGLRLDAVHAYVDRSAIHFIEQLTTEVAALESTLGRRLVVIAESDLNDPRVVTSREAGGLGADAQWSDDFHHALFAVLTPENANGYYADFGLLSQLAKSLRHVFVYDGLYSSYRRRIHGRPVESLSRHKFLGYIQNHDQVGNRAAGDRISHTAGLERAKIAAALVLTSPFVPLIFQGEEWAASSPFQYFADHQDPDLARAVSEGRKREFGAFGWNPDEIPDPESADTFQRSRLNWSEQAKQPHADMLASYRALIGLRRSTACLNDGEPRQLRVFYDEHETWIRMERGTITVICNLGKENQRFRLPKRGRILFDSRGKLQIEEDAIAVPPDSVVIIGTPE
ncbi:MAG TPA: malto-oligosyltrehalose trehalohydrolase [Terracidiphilus sp.]|nr:malto-oligosyltrehalose trehalohydrolase [Terracidiphilus sp.]